MSFVVSASQWLFLAALLKRKPSGNASEGKVEASIVVLCEKGPNAMGSSKWLVKKAG